MGLTSFFGLLFLAAGPLAVVYIACIARKSFLVLLSLGSAFYWLVTLFVISALFRGFEPLNPSIGPYIGLTLVAVAIQSIARWGLWRFHCLCVRVLSNIARQQDHAGAALSVADHFSLSLAHGLAHGTVHSLFFCISWLPLIIGDGTIYADTCPQMSYYLVSALITLGMAGVLTGGTIVCFDGLEMENYKQGVAPSVAHLAAALLTLVNITQGGCLISVPLILAGGVGMSVWAGLLWWKRTGQAMRRPPINHHAPREE